jgi:hypothetical protein
MDRKELEQSIEKELYFFREESAKRGYPLREACLVPFEAWRPMYNIEVYADWIENMSCGEALHILTPIMFDTMSKETRRNVFIIKILDKEDAVHCVEETPFVAVAEMA